MAFEILPEVTNLHCKGKTELFYPPTFTKETKIQRTTREAAAIAICTGCEIIDASYDYAVRNKEYGVWGATTELDRAKKGGAPTHSITRSVANASRLYIENNQAS